MNYHCLNPIAQIGLDLFDDMNLKYPINFYALHVPVPV